MLLRHGQSEWNEANLFTGWADVKLTTLGKNEAAMGATQMWKEGLQFDVAFTSLLTVCASKSSHANFLSGTARAHSVCCAVFDRILL